MKKNYTLKAYHQLKRVNKIVEPWIPVSVERLPWTVILDGGTEVTIACPLGAAVEIEEAGYCITAQR